MAKKDADGLTVQQRRFVEAWNGSIKETARLVDISYDYARQLVAKPHIKKAIEAQSDRLAGHAHIAGRAERLAFWTKVMNDESVSVRDRLRAAELLGKANCDFSEKRILEGGDKPVSLQVVTGIPRVPGDDDGEDFLE